MSYVPGGGKHAPAAFLVAPPVAVSVA